MVPKWPWFLVEVAVKASGDLATLLPLTSRGIARKVQTWVHTLKLLRVILSANISSNIL